STRFLVPEFPAAMALLYVLLVLLIANGFCESSCPKECECDVSPTTNETLSAYCGKGGLDDSKLTVLLHSLPAGLKSLEISSPPWRPTNNFRWNDNLNRFTQLRQLRLIGCSMPSMSRPRLPSLELLDISSNKIDHATMANFAGFPALKILDLSHNRLSILPTGVFAYLKKLTTLSLANNSISEASSSILRGLSNLRSLNLDKNRIPVSHLNDLIGDVPTLEELSLAGCHINPLHNLTLERLPELRSLDLSGNNLKSIPSSELSVLPRLSSLSLSKNRIETIDPCAFCGNNLTKLDLSHNKLGLRGKTLVEGAFDGTSLTHLDLGFNHLEDLDSATLGIAQRTLKSLSLSGNFLRTFDASLTHTLHALTSLHLAHNMITELPLLFPPEYYQLKLLNLSSNQISYLPDNLGALLGNLKDFDLSHNRFSSLSTAAAEFINTVDHVYLSGNPWDCNCGLQQLQAHMKDRFVLRRQLEYGATRCAYPSLLKGQSVLTAEAVNDCAVLFGARYGLSQTNELLVLLGALLVAGALLVILMCLLYHGRERQYKGSYVTRECSRTPLTMTLPPHGISGISCSTSSSSTSDPNENNHHLSPPLPPPPPKAMSALYFGV
ncbi:hypothetical protein PFISCL1PPCAC_21701, partial [Pristionchus fissidentatus]